MCVGCAGRLSLFHCGCRRTDAVSGCAVMGSVTAADAYPVDPSYEHPSAAAYKPPLHGAPLFPPTQPSEFNICDSYHPKA